VDFSWVRAGPWATRWLGAFGAEIIKIEWPENERGRLPSTTTPHDTDVNLNTSGNFNDTNVNKKEPQPERAKLQGAGDRQAAHSCLRPSDREFQLPGLAKWGLGYDEMSKIKPDIV
jgi:crotonobetainyl-CoA:carnitine CoA-transferase CaiB-like acyl-CoA transferase